MIGAHRTRGGVTRYFPTRRVWKTGENTLSLFIFWSQRATLLRMSAATWPRRSSENARECALTGLNPVPCSTTTQHPGCAVAPGNSEFLTLASGGMPLLLGDMALHRSAAYPWQRATCAVRSSRPENCSLRSVSALFSDRRVQNGIGVELAWLIVDVLINDETEGQQQPVARKQNRYFVSSTASGSLLPP